MSCDKEYVAVVGTFDGMHRGHRFLLDKLIARAGECGCFARVYTFTAHPAAFLCPAKAPGMLSTVDEKTALLEQSGVDDFSIVDFADVARLTARQYIQQLASQGVRHMLIGYDNRFGCDRLVTLQQFADAAKGTGVTIEQAPELTRPDGSPINSSVIRQMLSAGNLDDANSLLGYEYTLTGTVVTGKQLGRTIGFPTANVEPLDASKLVPANGVYACIATIDGETVPAMVNIGHRPTVDLPGAPASIEAHLIDFDRDIYGHTATLQFVKRLRDEQRFATLDQLKTQLAHDRLTTLTTLH